MTRSASSAEFRFLVARATDAAREKTRAVLAQALRLSADADKEKRLGEGLCSRCYYVPSPKLVGHAFTTWNCFLCAAEHTHPNTGVPMLCKECAHIYGLCTRCCADDDLRLRRKVVRVRRAHRVPKPPKEKA